ncbi:MAG TPA: hypothetical protein VGE69_14105 [Pseudomonadales bacterium]
MSLNGNLVRIFSHVALDPDRPHDKTACMNICRKTLSGAGYRVVIPLDNAYQYVQTGDLIAKAVEFAHVLYQGTFTRSQVVGICNVIDDGLYELLNMLPPEERRQIDIENEMDRLGVVFRVNDEAIIDTRH